jgi:hypothetical protein
VRGADGSRSGQWDLLVYNALDTPVLHSSEDPLVLPIEGILAAISVKTKVDKGAIEEVAEASAALREMPRSELPAGLPSGIEQRPATFLFGFDGPRLDVAVGHVKAATKGEGSRG